MSVFLLFLQGGESIGCISIASVGCVECREEGELDESRRRCAAVEVNTH